MVEVCVSNVCFKWQDAVFGEATWCIGQSVKIRSVSVEDAERIQTAGPGDGSFFSLFDKTYEVQHDSSVCYE